MKLSSKLLCVVAAFLVTVSSPVLAFFQGPVRGPMIFSRHVPHLSGLRRQKAVGVARPFDFGRHRRHGPGVAFVSAGVFGYPYPIIDDPAPPELVAVQPTPLLLPAEARRPPDEPVLVGPPAFVYAQIGFPEFAPRIIYRHPAKRPSGRRLVVYYGIQRVDRMY